MAEHKQYTPREAKPIPNVSKTLEYLSRAFQEATRGLPLAQRVRWKDPSPRELDGQRHCDWQVDMAHFVHNISNSPSYFVPKLVADCNKMIDDIKAYREQK